MRMMGLGGLMPGPRATVAIPQVGAHSLPGNSCSLGYASQDLRGRQFLRTSHWRRGALERGTVQEKRGSHGSQLMSFPLNSSDGTKTCSFCEVDGGGTNFSLMLTSVATNY